MARPNTGLVVTPKRARLLNTGALGPAQLTERERKYAVRVGNLPPGPDDLRRMAKAEAKRASKALKRAHALTEATLVDATVALRADGATAPGNYCHRTHQVIG